jgi:DNA polymerase
MHTVLLPGGGAAAEIFRREARRLFLAGVEPGCIEWRTDDGHGELFQPEAPEPAASGVTVTVPRAYADLANLVLCHTDGARFALLYRLLWALRGRRDILDDAAHPDVAQARLMARAVRRDVHKMTAFVRFRAAGDHGGAVYVAWFEPEFHIVEAAAPFFARRFTAMRWTILTPKGSVYWDGRALRFGPPAERSEAPGPDPLEDIWRSYYAAIFNPARLMVKAMQKEMPKKYWKNLPEASLIPGLIAGAGKRAEAMVAAEASEPSLWSRAIGRQRPAQAPPDTGTLEGLRSAAAECARCGLCRHATQTVFGEGPPDARLMLVGEQAGDQEDLQGKPFVGPAGQVLDAALREIGLPRAEIYVTNAVKHFKFEPRGKRRIHKRPDAGEIEACRWWLDRERALVRPKLIVALGATALRSLTGSTATLTSMRGRLHRLADDTPLLVTVHPSYILRLPDAAAARAERQRFAADLAEARRIVASLSEPGHRPAA